jgi:hypothetical protein
MEKSFDLSKDDFYEFMFRTTRHNCLCVNAFTYEEAVRYCDRKSIFIEEYLGKELIPMKERKLIHA